VLHGPLGAEGGAAGSGIGHVCTPAGVYTSGRTALVYCPCLAANCLAKPAQSSCRLLRGDTVCLGDASVVGGVVAAGYQSFSVTGTALCCACHMNV
jgi:hypothetical protein